jgi:hypothetical protein
MTSLQKAIGSNPSDTQLIALKNLSNCIQSAASVVSSASTTLGVEHADHVSVAHSSDFGGLFPSEPGETMLRWMSSNTVYEFEEEPTAEPSSRQHKVRSDYPRPVEGSPEPEQSDSDTDLEMEIVQALLKRGKEKFQAKDFGAAERLFRNCLTRISSNLSMLSLHHIPRSKTEIMTLLLDVYLAKEKWDEAQSLLLEKIGIGSQDKSSDNGRVLKDILTLIDVLIHKSSYAEAHLYGRRALKGYRKMGLEGVPGVESSLKALMRICHANGNWDEGDAYAEILSDFLQLNPPNSNSTGAAESNAQRPESPSPVQNPRDGSPEASKQETNRSDGEKLLNTVSLDVMTTNQMQSDFGPIQIPQIAPEKAGQYAALFEKSPAQNGVLLIEDAKLIFERSGLPSENQCPTTLRKPMPDSPQQPPALVPDLLTESPHLCSIIDKEKVPSKTLSNTALKDMSSPKLDRTPPISSSDADKEWTMDRVLLWLASNQCSSDWQETFKHLNIHGSIFLGLGSGYGGRGSLGILHQQAFPRLAKECSTSGTLWDQVRERAEGKRIRRLIKGIVTGKARVVTDLSKRFTLLDLTSGILRRPPSSPLLKVFPF